jgi:hypothetical protein
MSATLLPPLLSSQSGGVGICLDLPPFLDIIQAEAYLNVYFRRVMIGGHPLEKAAGRHY